MSEDNQAHECFSQCRHTLDGQCRMQSQLPQSRKSRFILAEYSRVDHLLKRGFSNAVAVKCIAPHVKESGFLPVEFGIRENLSSACRISLMIEIQKTSSTNKKHVQYMESGFQVVKSRIQQCFGFPHMGQRHRTGSPYKKTNFATRKSKKKRTDLTNGSLNTQKFLHLNPFLI